MSNHRACAALGAILVVVVATTAACADGSGGGDPAATPSATESSPTTEPAPGGGTAGRTADPVGEWDLVLADVRVGAHPGFDRLVLEFTGTGIPGWSVNYVDETVADGSGEVVVLRGDAFLDVYASGTAYPGEDRGDGARPGRRGTGDARAITDLHVVGTFEGYTQVLVAIRGQPAPFRVHALQGPPRLVVDVDRVQAD